MNYKNLKEELTQAMIVECLECGRYDLVIELSKLAQEHLELGCMTKEMQDKRDNEIALKLLNGSK